MPLAVEKRPSGADWGADRPGAFPVSAARLGRVSDARSPAARPLLVDLALLAILWALGSCGGPPAAPADGAAREVSSDAWPPLDLSRDLDAGRCTAGRIAFGKNVLVGRGAEVSADAAPDGTLLVAYCNLARNLVDATRGDGATLAFTTPVAAPAGFCDPTVAYVPGTHSFFLADDCMPTAGGYGICLQSTADGATFTTPLTVDSFGPSDGLVDRPWIFPAMGPGGSGTGAILTWNRYPAPLSSNVGNTLVADIAATGTPGTPVMLTSGSPTSTSAPGAADLAGNAFAVGNVATDLQPASEHGPMMLWSRPAGGAWSERSIPSPGGPIYIYPAIAVTPRGTLLVLYTDEAASVYLIRSTDGGMTFSPPFRVNPGSTTPHTLLLWAAAGADGIARFTWYEALSGATPALWNVFYARSTDDGRTVSAPIQVNDGGPFPGTNGEYDEAYRATSVPWLGDFTAVFTDGTRDFVAFTDNRDPVGPGVYVAATRCPLGGSD